jgi:hypothetical protein
MTIEAMKQALEAWQTSVYGSERHHKAMLLAMTNMGQAIEQAEKQEPVAWITHESKWRLTGGGNAGGTVPVHAKQSNTAKYPLYTTPQPQREWVGLTDEEIGDLKGGYQSGRIGSFVELTQAIEAKLKEKNT